MKQMCICVYISVYIRAQIIRLLFAEVFIGQITLNLSRFLTSNL